MSKARGDSRRGSGEQVWMSPIEMEQALVNVIRNAIESRPHGGRVELSTRRAPGAVRIQIRDDGRAIEPEALKHLSMNTHLHDLGRHPVLRPSGFDGGLSLHPPVVRGRSGGSGASGRHEDQDCGPATAVRRRDSHWDVDGGFKQAVAQARRFLVENHDLDPGPEPLWRDGCVQPAIAHAISGGSFRPARGNVLLVGDAAGLNVPITGEGLNMALKSGLEAAEAVCEAKRGGGKAAELYLKKVDAMLARFQQIQAYGASIGTAAATNDPEAYADALIDS